MGFGIGEVSGRSFRPKSTEYDTVPALTQDGVPIIRHEDPDNRAERRLKLAFHWKPGYQMYPLTFGPVILQGAALASAVPIMNHYRRALNLRKDRVGRVMHVLCGIFIPTLGVLVAQHGVVTRSMLLYRTPPCPVCYEVRSAVIQFIGGVIAPVISCPILGMFLAQLHYTKAMPDLKHRREAFQFYWDLHKGIGKKVLPLGALQLAVGMVAVKFQLECFQKILDKEYQDTNADQNRPGGEKLIPADQKTISVTPAGVPSRYIVRKSH